MNDGAQHHQIDPVSAVAPPLSGRSSSSQRWSDLFFIHWRVPSELVAPLLPPGLRPDEHDGSSWVGLIPFVLDRATIFGSPPIPYFGSFVEVNVRLYAIDQHGRRGVVFVSLEASRLAAVLAARAIFSIPYVWSATTLERVDKDFTYRSRRHTGHRASSLIRATAGSRRVVADPLAEFLTARWGLFTQHRGRTIFLRNHHEPWDLYDATLNQLDDSLLAAGGFSGIADKEPDSILYSPGVTTRFASGS